MNKNQNIQAARWQKIAAVMQQKKLDIVLICASSQDFSFGFALTGLKPILYHYLFLDRPSGRLQKGYFVPHFLVNRLGLSDKPHVKTFDEKKIPQEFARFLKKCRKVGIIGPAPAVHFSLTPAELVFLDDDLWTVLNKKSPAEIAAVKKVTGILAETLNKAARLIKPGLRMDQVAEQLDREILKKADALAFPTLVESFHGQKNILCLLGWKAKILAKDIVYVNVGAEHEGFFADIGRTFFVNNPLWQKKYALVEKAFKAFVKALKPAIELHILPGLLEFELRRAGLSKCHLDKKYLGHSIGFNILNLPYIGEEIFTEEKLQANTTLSLVAHLEMEGQNLQLQETVLIGEKSGEILSR